MIVTALTTLIWLTAAYVAQALLFRTYENLKRARLCLRTQAELEAVKHGGARSPSAPSEKGRDDFHVVPKPVPDSQPSTLNPQP
jgi:hypothetical protein